jgi:dienelactone hydrolase
MPDPRPQELSFRSQGVECRGSLYSSGDGRPGPCVVLAHGFGGVRDQSLDRYAARFAEHGWSAFTFDYRYFGDSGGMPRQLVSNSAQLDDWRAAIAYVRQRQEVDPDRIALWGTSTSGGHVVKLAAADPRVIAVVVQMPFASGFAQLRLLAPTQGLRLLWAGLRDQIGAWFHRPPLMIPAAGRPYSLAVITTPDSLSGLTRTAGRNSKWRNSTVARFALTTAFYNPGRSARQLGCPLLVCVADGDDLIARKPALRLAERADATLRCYRYSHFEMYDGPGFERVVADQAAFLHGIDAGTTP